ncbi:MAG: aminotransferase class I/II-fold pyridoxal phosphate-dependent enzyme [Chlorobi bacterium]|nr:aminotransferase class I/II-fold pyridoxal phosphate-dependent enzyme [Chlorobiota bacterium]
MSVEILMQDTKIEKMTLDVTGNLRDALAVIDKNGAGLCFVIDNEDRLLGVLSDGDIRRALLKGDTLNTKVDEVMAKNFIALHIDTPNHQIQETISKKIKYIPLIDSDGILKDYSSNLQSRCHPIMQPSLRGNELEYVIDCIKTNWISSQGSYVQKFEEVMAEYCHIPNALAVSNGTVALHLSLVALGVGEGDEVIVPNLTFAACVNAVIHTGARPVLVDITSDTWTLDPSEVKSSITDSTKVIMPVHLYGHPCDMDAIMAIARQHNLLVLEDCAEALGTSYKGKPVGSFGDSAAFSFFGNKTITTGEGGMVLFHDKNISEKAKILRDHGMSKTKRYWHNEVGFNYRLTNIQAAIGVAQMERVDEILKKKHVIADTYNHELFACSRLTLPPSADWATNSYWMFTVLLDDYLSERKDKLITNLLNKGIETRPVFYPLDDMKVFKQYSGSKNSVSRNISRRGLSLPSYVDLSKEDVRDISKLIIKEINNLD